MTRYWGNDIINIKEKLTNWNFKRKMKMKITIIHAQSHKGSTYHIANLLADKLDGEVTEFFLPKDFNEFCCGCKNCFIKGEERCPHFEKLSPITMAIDGADVIILASPVYVFHATGAMKAFLDHYGYRWMPHRPEGLMFRKQGVCISTAAGAGVKSANKDMSDSLLFWGIGKIYRFGTGINATSWEYVSDKKQRYIEKNVSSIAKKILNRHNKVRPGIKTRVLFSVMRFFQKKGLNPIDTKYWKEHGWLDGKKPW